MRNVITMPAHRAFLATMFPSISSRLNSGPRMKCFQQHLTFMVMLVAELLQPCFKTVPR